MHEITKIDLDSKDVPTDASAQQAKLDQVKAFFQNGKIKGKPLIKADLAKGTTKAKTATTPAAKRKIAEKIKEASKTQARLSAPGELARCRAIVEGNMLAGALLYRMVYLHNTITSKMKRNGKEYVRLSRDELAMSAGLSISELKNKALPLVKKYAGEFVTIEAMGRGADKRLWFWVDRPGFQEAINGSGYELKIKSGEGLDTYPKSHEI